MKYWDLAGEGQWRRRCYGTLMVLACLGFVGMTAANVALEMEPRYGVRTDEEGHSDLVRLPAAVAPTQKEAVVFAQDIALHLFSWDPTTKGADRAYVRKRCSAMVWDHIDHIVPGYEKSLDPSTKGRVDVDIEATRVIGERLPYQVEIQMGIEFSGKYFPPGLGEKDPYNPRRERYGFLFTLQDGGRSRSNPAGLEVIGITPMALGAAS